MGLAAVCSMFASTAEQRAEARQRLARHNWKFGAATAILVTLLFWR